MKNVFFTLAVIYLSGLIGYNCSLGYKEKINPFFETTPEIIESVSDTVCTDVIVYDTVTVINRSELPPQVKPIQFTEQEKIEFVKYVNTQQRICNEDQWAVIQVMLNICKAGGWSWTEYSTKHHHEGSFFDNCRAGLV